MFSSYSEMLDRKWCYGRNTKKSGWEETPFRHAGQSLRPREQAFVTYHHRAVRDIPATILHYSKLATPPSLWKTNLREWRWKYRLSIFGKENDRGAMIVDSRARGQLRRSSLLEEAALDCYLHFALKISIFTRYCVSRTSLA
jgi:hypothetical protein